MDYELKVQCLVETASSHKYGSGLELSFAVAMGHLEYVRFLVEKKNYNPMQGGQSGFASFHLAAVKGNVEVFKYFVTQCNCNPACPGPLGLAPLHLASEQGHLDIVKYLVIEQQIDPLCEDEYQNTPLHRACAGGHQAVVEFLTSELVKYTPITEVVSDLKTNGTIHLFTLQLGMVTWAYSSSLFLIGTVIQTFQVIPWELLFTMLLSMVIFT